MSAIGVKGDRDGLILTLPDTGKTPEAIAALRAHLEQAGAFFKGARVTLDVGALSVGTEELQSLRDLLSEWAVDLVALRATDEGTRAVAIAMDIELPFVVQLDQNAYSEPADEAREEGIEAVLVRRTLRGGQAVRHPGAVVILGDVNPGAEVIAGGDVAVWGTLRGVVQAGAFGDDTAIVCALKLAPTQLRIGNHIAISPEERENGGRKRFRFRAQPQQRPEVARVQEGVIVVEPWTGNPGSTHL